MSGPRRTNAQLMSVNRAAALCGSRKPSKGKIQKVLQLFKINALHGGSFLIIVS